MTHSDKSLRLAKHIDCSNELKLLQAYAMCIVIEVYNHASVCIVQMWITISKHSNAMYRDHLPQRWLTYRILH